MEESSGNDQSPEEKVINVVVFQEPPNWQKANTNDSFINEKIPLKDVIGGDVARGENGNGSHAARHNHNNAFYKPQSFIINANINQGPIVNVKSSMKYEVKLHSDNGCTTFASSALKKNYVSQSCPQYSTNSKVQTEMALPDLQIDAGYYLNLTDEEEQTRCQKRAKLGRHKNMSLPVKTELFSSPSSLCQNQDTSMSVSTACIPSTAERQSQLFSSYPSLPFTPVVVSSSSQSSMAAAEPETPIVATTPDSGYYTPSLFEPSSSSNSSTVNPFFTSTPRRSKSAGPQTSTPCLSETPKRLRREGLQQRFTDLCNAMDWDSLDDSIGGMSEDPKDGSDSGEAESSPNSSLRSVQWLKGFSIGDSVKPLLSSPPTPSSKNESLQSSFSNITMTTYAKPSSVVTNTANLSTSIPGLPSPSFRPLPVIMAPKIPTYLQTQGGLTPCSASSSSISESVMVEGGISVSMTIQDTSSNNNSCSSTSGSCKKSSQRKALEELKMNKPERNIGRSKYTGKIFSRPGYSYMDLIKMAMQSSDEGEMTLKQIVTWIEEHFPFFKHEAKDSWKSSIRHNLSLHSDFMKADDKKHGCKWKLCNDVAQPSLHVPAPQEMTSVQTAFLKKAKKNVPQPILPKVNAYALVPIHNLANPVDGPQQHPSSMPRKPIHILPKQMGEACAQPTMLKQEVHDAEFLDHHHQQYHVLTSQETQSEQRQAFHQLLQKGPTHNSMASVHFDDQTFITASDYVSNVPAGIYQSSDSNSSHSLGFPSLKSFDQSLPMTSEFANNSTNVDSVSHFEVVDPRQSLSSFSCTNEHDKSTALLDQSLQGLSLPQKKSHHQNVSLNSVVEIRQEQGANSGEKKIVFVLQDGENGKQSKKIETTKLGNSTQGSGRKSSKNLNEIFNQELTAGKKSLIAKTFNFGKKKSREGQRSHRQRKGPVLNLQSVLQSTMEDKKASDTIGLLLQEEDESKKLEGEQSFTRVKAFSERESHLNSHMLRALQEQTANIMSHDDTERNMPGTISDSNTDSNGSFKKLHSCKHILPKAGTRLLPFSNHKKGGFSLRDRMGMVKSKCGAHQSSSLDIATSTIDELQGSHSSKKAVSCRDNNSYDLSVTKSASQLVFRRLSSSDHSSVLLASTESNQVCSSSSNISLSDDLSHAMGESDKERRVNSSACRRVGNILRTKSRRKQVHVPLAIEISPVRSKFHSNTDNDDQSVICVDEGRSQFISLSDESDGQTYHQISVTAEQIPTSLCTEIQQPSLKVLQEKPLDQYHLSRTSLKEKPIKAEPSGISFFDFPTNCSDVDKAIENIFICSGSPVKNEVSGDSSSITSTHITDQLSTSEFDTPPSMLHFLSTFPKDMEFSSQSLGSDTHKAFRCDDTYQGTQSLPGHQTSRISFTVPDNHHNHPHHADGSHGSFLSPRSNFLETPSPPRRYPPRTPVPNSSSIRKQLSCKDDSRGFKSISLSLSPVSGTVGANTSHFKEHNNFTLWNNTCSIDTPPCGTMLQPLSSSSPSATTSKSPPEPSTNTVSSSKLESTRSGGNTKKHENVLMSHNSTEQGKQKHQHHHQDDLLPLYCITNNENNRTEPSFSSVHHIHSQSASSASSSTTTSSPTDLTACISYSLTTPPCGNSNINTTNTTIGSSTNTTPLVFSVPGAATHPFILSPSPSTNSTNSNQQLTELFPTFAPESLSSILDPSIMDNLDLFINSLPGLGPGFPNIQLSPHP